MGYRRRRRPKPPPLEGPEHEPTVPDVVAPIEFVPLPDYPDRDDMLAELADAMEPGSFRDEARDAFEPDVALFPAQLAAYRDASRWKAYICARQAGKTTEDAYELLRNGAVDKPGTDSVFVAPTLGQAVKIIWRDLVEMAGRYRLGAKADITNHVLSLPNGSTIQLRGCDTAADIEWFRGNRFSLVVVDECQSMGAHLRELIWDVLRPTLMRWKGRVVLTGTIGLVAAGFWHDVVTGRIEGWSPHTWYLPDNPHIPDATGEMEDFARQLGGSMSPADVEKYGGVRQAGEHHPKYVREILCRWVRDDSTLVYRIDRELNTWTALPEGKPTGCVVAGDLGTRDFSAVGTIKWWKHDPAFYVTRERVKAGCDLEDVRAELEEAIEEDHPDRIVLDEGGIGLMVAETLRRRHGMPVEPAQKMAAGGVVGQMDLLNTDIVRGRLKCADPSRFIDSAAALQWDQKAAMLGKRALDGHEPDVCAMIRYGWFVAQQLHLWVPITQTPEETRREALIRELAAQAARRDEMTGDGMRNDLAALGWS